MRMNRTTFLFWQNTIVKVMHKAYNINYFLHPDDLKVFKKPHKYFWYIQFFNKYFLLFYVDMVSLDIVKTIQTMR